MSARVDALERVDYVVTNDISVFVKENDISTFINDNDISTFVTQNALDASFNALDTSIIALDASVKELAEGGGSFDPSDINASIGDISTRVSVIENNYVDSDDISTFITGNDVSTYYKKGDIKVIFGGANTLKNNSGSYYVLGSSNILENGKYGPIIALGSSNTITTSSGATYYPGIAIGKENTIGNTGYCIGTGNKTTKSLSIGYNNTNHQENAITVGQRNTTGKGWSYIFGINCKTSNFYEVATGSYNNTSNVANTSTHFSIGNGASDSSRHNAFEVRQSGDIYIPDVSAAGEYYEKPMINLQQKIYALDASIQSLSGAGSFDPTYLEDGLLDASARVDFLGDLTVDVSSRVDTLDASVSEIYSMIPIITYDPSTKILNIITE